MRMTIIVFVEGKALFIFALLAQTLPVIPTVSAWVLHSSVATYRLALFLGLLIFNL